MHDGDVDGVRVGAGAAYLSGVGVVKPDPAIDYKEYMNKPTLPPKKTKRPNEAPQDLPCLN